MALSSPTISPKVPESPSSPMGASSEAGGRSPTSGARPWRSESGVRWPALRRSARGELLGERHGGAAHLRNLVDEMDGEADRFALVRQGALDGLLDPPRGVGRELAALARVKTFDGLDQADIAFANEVKERKAKILIVHRDLHDEPEIGGNHVVAGGLVAAADALRQLDFLLDRQEGGLADLLEVKLEVAALAVGMGASGAERSGFSRKEGGASNGAAVRVAVGASLGAGSSGAVRTRIEWALEGMMGISVGPTEIEE